MVELGANAKICLGIGYRIDHPEQALASAMMLVGVGERAYGERLDHYLMYGFGVPPTDGSRFGMDANGRWRPRKRGNAGGGRQRWKSDRISGGTWKLEPGLAVESSGSKKLLPGP